MNRRVTCLAGLLLAVGTTLTAINGCKNKSTEPIATSDWTIMLYADGNNQHDITPDDMSYCIRAAQELETIGSTDKIQVIAMVSSVKTGGIAKYYHIESHTDEQGMAISSPVLADRGPADMSNWQTFQEFLAFAIGNYPAQKYMLIVADDGAGWEGSCLDELNGGGHTMHINNMSTALKQVMSQKGISRFEVIAFLSPIMSTIEVAYELREFANWLIGSESGAPICHHIASAQWIPAINETPTMIGTELAPLMANQIFENAQSAQDSMHISVVDLSKMAQFAAKFDYLNRQLYLIVSDNWFQVLNARDAAYFDAIDDLRYVDLKAFVENVIQQPPFYGSSMVRLAADSLLAYYGQAVTLNMTNLPNFNTGGLLLYMPSQEANYDSAGYQAVDFHNMTWDAFLDEYVSGVSGIIYRSRISGKVVWPGHTLSNHTYAFADSFDHQYFYLISQVSVNTFDSSYTIILPPSSTTRSFIIEAQDDIDASYPWYPNSGDGWGFYDRNGDGTLTTADAIQISPGQRLNNINIVLGEYTSLKSMANQFRKEH